VSQIKRPTAFLENDYDKFKRSGAILASKTVKEMHG